MITFGSDPLPLKIIISFSATGPIFDNFWKRVYFNLNKVQNTFKKISKKEKKLVLAKQMSVAPRKMSASPQEMSVVMSAATRLMFVKDQRGCLMCPQGPMGPTLPLYMKKL